MRPWSLVRSGGSGRRVDLRRHGPYLAITRETRGGKKTLILDFLFLCVVQVEYI